MHFDCRREESNKKVQFAIWEKFQNANQPGSVSTGAVPKSVIFLFGLQIWLSLCDILSSRQGKSNGKVLHFGKVSKPAKANLEPAWAASFA